MARPDISELFSRPINPDYLGFIAEENKYLSDRARIQARSGLAGLDSEVSLGWSLNGALTNEILVQIEEGGVVLELGCGPTLRTFQQEHLARRKPRFYVGVDIAADPGYQESDTVEGLGPYYDLDTNAPFDGVIVRADVLSALSKIQAKFSVVIANGLDGLVLDSDTDYAEAVMDELHRVTAVGGFVIGASLVGDGILSALPDHTGKAFQVTHEAYADVGGTVLTSMVKRG